VSGPTFRAWRAARSDSARTAGLGFAVAGGNFISLVFTVLFARLLGASDYGSLAALLSAFFILSIPGTGLQAMVAREMSASAAISAEARPMQAVHRLARATAVAAVVIAALSALFRAPLAAVCGVDEEWAAALVPPTAVLWILVSLQRGELQGLGRYRAVGLSVVGEAAGRLALGLVLVMAGLDVAGAFAGETVALIACWLALTALLPGTARAGADAAAWVKALLREAGAPVAAMALLALLQNLDVIVVKHVAAAAAAGAYAAASLAAKTLVWVAVGFGMYLLPEASRRAGLGEDTRRLFMATLALIALTAIPVLAVFALAGEPLLTAVFGDEFARGSDVLTILGLAMTALACTYLAVQYLLALRDTRFLWLLGAAAVAEPFVLAAIGGRLVALATGLLAIQAATAATLIYLERRRAR
jgi:O-antigen/teichoic acid export membrane protein